MFSEYDVQSPQLALARYEGHISPDGTTLSGIFFPVLGKQQTTRDVCLSIGDLKRGKRGRALHWLTRPRGAFAEFIPANPLYWVLAVLTPSVALSFGSPRIFGAGFFSDAGDVEGHSVLFFALESSKAESSIECSNLVDADDAHKTTTSMIPSFQKTYEQLSTLTEGGVSYTDCVLEGGRGAASGASGCKSSAPSNAAGHLWLRGKWANATAGTFGRFDARRHPPGIPIAEALVLCARCSQPIWPGEPRWACEWPCCASVDQPWAVCFREGCLLSEETRAHPCIIHSPLSPAAGLEENVARGSTCGMVVMDAFRRFARRPLVGSREIGGSAFFFAIMPRLVPTRLLSLVRYHLRGLRQNHLLL